MNVLSIGYDDEIVEQLKNHFKVKHSIAPSVRADTNWWDLHNVNLDTRKHGHSVTASEVKHLVYKFQMYSAMNARRYNAINGQQSEIKNIFMLHANIASHLLNIHKIELILFANLPHEGFDFVFYTLAKLRGIRTIMTNQTQFEDLFWIVESLDDFGTFLGPELTNNDNLEIKLPAEWFYVPSGKSFLDRWPLISLIVALLNKPVKTPVHLIDYHYKKKLIASHKPSIQKQSELDMDYVYYPLHLEPEMTVTSLVGDDGIYSDQLLILETLARKLDPDIKIVVKENPKQNYKFRDQYFYKRINSIPNVLLVANELNSRELIANSVGVATLSGTAGWEAICIGKPCLTFGNAWYNTLSGSTQYVEGLDLSDWLRKGHTPFIQILKEVRQLLNRCGSGVVDPDYIKIIKNYNSGRNAISVSDSIKRYVEKCC